METVVVCSGKKRPHWSNGQMAGDAQADPLIGGGEEPEEELAASGVERGEANLVDDDHVDPEKGVDDAADRVVGQAAVEGLDQLGGGEVADPVAGLNGGVAEGDEQVRLAGPGGAEQTGVLVAAQPLQRGQVVEGRLGHRGELDLELVEALLDREAGELEASAQVGLVASGNLGLGADQVRRGLRTFRWPRTRTLRRPRARDTTMGRRHCRCGQIPATGTNRR